MSNRCLFVNFGYIKNNAPLKNGLGRFIPQLMRMTIKFDKEGIHSAGVRSFIQSDLVDFARKNQHVAIYVKPRRHRTPVVVAEYLNGERHWQSLFCYTREEVNVWLDLLRNSSGKEYQIQTKYEFSEHPSIQGMWNSFTNKNPKLATATFPLDDSLVNNNGFELSATEKLKRLFESQQQTEISPVLEATKQ